MEDTQIRSIQITSTDPLILNVTLSNKEAEGKAIKVELAFAIIHKNCPNPRNKETILESNSQTIHGDKITFTFKKPDPQLYTYESEKIYMCYFLKYQINGSDPGKYKIEDLNKYTPPLACEDVPPRTFKEKAAHRGIMAFYNNLPLFNRIVLPIYFVLGLLAVGYLFWWNYFGDASPYARKNNFYMYLLLVGLFFTVLIASALQETYKKAEMTLSGATITPDTKIPLRQLFTASHKTNLKEVFIRVIAENRENLHFRLYKDQLIINRRPNPDLRPSDTVRSAVLLEKKIDYVKAGEKIENYCSENVDFKKVFEKLYPPCLIDDTGVDLQWYVEITTPTTRTIKLGKTDKNLFDFNSTLSDI